MGEFKKVNVKIFGKKAIKSSPDIVYWKKLGVSVIECIPFAISFGINRDFLLI